MLITDIAGLTRKKVLEKAPHDIISNPWRRLVFDRQGRVTMNRSLMAEQDRGGRWCLMSINL